MIEIDGNSLSIEDIQRIAIENQSVTLAPGTAENIRRARGWVEAIINSGKPVYGINTGYGIFADQNISPGEIRKLNRNLILSHAVGTGTPLPVEIVRAAILIRANTLAKGHSGVRLEVVETLLELLNHGVHPRIPSQGSLGSSGDLAPLSHLGLVISTDESDLESESGQAEYQGKLYSGQKAMQKAGIKRLVLEAKEGIALNNGATFSAAIAALACAETSNLLEISEISLAMSLEALRGCSAAFDPRIHSARQHPGQMAVAARIQRLTDGSTLLDSTDRVQDAYSLRCGPQVQGPAWDTLAFVSDVITREINAATDNPLLFPDGTALSGGNFHGEPIGLVMDFLGIVLTEISGISERRIYRLTDASHNQGLPPMLVDKPEDAGLNSGMMMPQYTAASLVLENRGLATPDSIQSLPTSAGQEDHNANAMTAARNTWQILNNTKHVLALEIYAAARALDLRLREDSHVRLGAGVAAVYRKIREHIPYQAGDSLWGPEIDQVRKLIESKELTAAVPVED